MRGLVISMCRARMSIAASLRRFLAIEQPMPCSRERAESSSQTSSEPKLGKTASTQWPGCWMPLPMARSALELRRPPARLRFFCWSLTWRAFRGEPRGD